jgi:hypothetical protein
LFWWISTGDSGFPASVQGFMETGDNSSFLFLFYKAGMDKRTLLKLYNNDVIRTGYCRGPNVKKFSSEKF